MIPVMTMISVGGAALKRSDMYSIQMYNERHRQQVVLYVFAIVYHAQMLCMYNLFVICFYKFYVYN